MGIDNAETTNLARLHLRFGWAALLLFLTLGIALEVLHGLKVRFYLDTAVETRRLMWTLAHAHGTLLGVVHLCFAFSLSHFAQWKTRPRNVASALLCAAAVLLPGGFFLGGVKIYGGDPGVGILLVPLGALLLLAAVLLTALAASASAKPPGPRKRSSAK